MSARRRLRVTGRFSKIGAVIALVLAAGAASLHALDEPTALTGTVRDGRGTPQAGAVVELLRPDTSVVASVFTDEYGRYILNHVIPGTYSLKATGTLFLPTLRENLQVLAHHRMAVNLTLSTVVEAFQWLPAKRRSVDEPDDEWAWTLRSAANRPLLRMLEDGPLVVVSDMDAAPVLKARVILHSGANEFGEGGLHNAFEIERSKQDDQRLILRADVGSSDGMGIASAETLVGYERQLTPDGNTLRTVAAFQELPEMQQTSSQQGIQAMVLRSAQSMQLTPSLEAEVGNQFEAVRGANIRYANQPFGAATWRNGDTAVSYRFATSRNAQKASEIDQAASVMPMITESNGILQLEHGVHQELRVEHAGDRTRYQGAIYSDRIIHPAVNGGGSLSSADLNSGYVVYDPVTELLNVAGNDYTTQGVVADIKSRVHGETWLTLAFADGDALTMPAFAAPPSLAEGLVLKPRRAQMYSMSLSGKIAPTGTHWRASYRWQPANTVTAVAPYDTESPDAYLSILLRQPLHCWHLLPNGVEALVDVRNLLAEGYRPFLTSDGSTLYFAQADRSVRGGLAFTF